MTTLQVIMEQGGAELSLVLFVGLFFSVVYFALDTVLFFITKHDFRHVNVYMLHFTRNGAERTSRDTDQASGGDALEKNLYHGQIALRDVYGNRLLFLRLLWAARANGKGGRVLRFGRYTPQILRPICYHCVADPAAVAARTLGLDTRREDFLAVYVYDDAPGREVYTYGLVFVRVRDVERSQYYRNIPPNAGPFDLFEEIADAYALDSTNGFRKVKIIAA